MIRATAAGCGRACARRGYTLIEMMIATTLLSLVVAAAFGVVIVMQNQAVRTTDRFTAEGEAQTIADRITKDLRTAVAPSSTTAAFASADANDVSFYANLADLNTGNGPTRLHAYTSLVPARTSTCSTRTRPRPTRAAVAGQLHVHGHAGEPARRPVPRHDATDLLVLRLATTGEPDPDADHHDRRPAQHRRGRHQSPRPGHAERADRRRSRRASTSATSTTTRTPDTMIQFFDRRFRRSRPTARTTRAGLAMIIVITVVMLMTLIPLAIFTQADRSSCRSRATTRTTSRRSRAAEAGVDDYLNRLAQNSNYWTYSATNPPTPDGNPAFTSWVTVPGPNTNGECFRYTPTRRRPRRPASCTSRRRASV